MALTVQQLFAMYTNNNLSSTHYHFPKELDGANGENMRLFLITLPLHTGYYFTDLTAQVHVGSQLRNVRGALWKPFYIKRRFYFEA